MKKHKQHYWKITNQSSWLGAGFSELYTYKDLLFRMIRKDLLMYYQQTLLGPFWLVLQPVLTVFAYVLVFDKVIGLPTEGVPSFLFYLTGITLWTLFADVFSGVSATFSQNAQIFSKVYFPRILAPLATLLLQMFRFSIQLMLLIIAALFYHFTGRYSAEVNWLFILPPALMIAGTAFGAGLIFSVLTVTYRDLVNLQHLLVRLLMFICPIFYSLSMVNRDKQFIVGLNPMAPLFESFRYAFLGKGSFSLSGLTYSFVFMLIFILTGLLFFNKKSDRLMDVV